MADNFVSIIIPVFNKWDYTRRCLDSLAAYTPRDDHEIIVIDNASTDATPAEITDKYPYVKYLRNNENTGFARANNSAARHAQADVLCFLNNDTLVTPDWLGPLVAAIRSDEAVAAAGPRLLLPDGTIQAAGIVFNYMGGPYHLGAHWRASHPYLVEPMEFNALTAACLVCRRKLFEEAGGFNEHYVNGFEDVDLCLTWRRSRLRLLHVPGSVVIHYESVSAGRHDRETDNIKLFFSRWRGKVVQDDLSYYINIKAAHPSLPFIAIIIYGVDSVNSLQSVMLPLLQHGDCSVSVLYLYQNDNGWHEGLRKYDPLITALSVADRRSITGWISRQTALPGFCGYLTIRGECFLIGNWDEDLCRYPQRNHQIVPLSKDASGFQSWLRFFSNIPKHKLQVLTDATAHMRGIFHNTCLLAGSTDETAVFFPREMALSPEAVVEAIITPAQPGKPSSVLPQWLSIKGRMVKEDIPIIMVCVVFRQFDERMQATTDSLLKETPAQETELIFFRLTPESAIDTPIDPAIEELCRVNNRIACFSARHPLTPHGARNIAVAATAAPFIIFVEPGVTFKRGWQHTLVAPLRKESVLGVSPIAFTTAGSIEETGTSSNDNSHERLCKWITGPCTAFRRIDFNAAGGYSEKPTAVETDADLCARMIALRGGDFVNALHSTVKA